MKALFLALIFIFSTACSIEFDAPSLEEQRGANLAESTSAPMKGKTLRYQDDELYELECSSYTWKFLLTEAGCLPVSVDSRYEGEQWVWEVSSANDALDLKFEEIKGKERMRKDGQEFFCYQSYANIITAAGDEEWFGSHLILSTKSLTKPSDIKPGDVAFVGFSDASQCQAAQ